jgi:hypothetical protein
MAGAVIAAAAGVAPACSSAVSNNVIGIAILHR